MTDRDGGLYCPACVVLLPALATPGSRVAAHLIDVASIGVSATLMTGLLIAVLHEGGLGNTPYEWAMSLFVGCATLAGGLQLMLVHQNGQSVGKRVMRIRVVTLDDRLPGVWRVLFLRNLAPLLLGFVPLLGIIFRIANIAALFSEENRALHDRFAGTKVMKAVDRGE